MTDICKEFPGVKALKGVDLTIESQKVTALIGANGAGKSTLMKVLSGVYNHYTGQITIDGEDVEIREPNTAKHLGIETVYQEVDTALEPNLSVAENIMVDYLVNGLGKKQFFNWNYIYKTSQDILDKLGLDDIDNRQLVGTMPLAKKQMVVIARAVLRDCRFLVLDEPTAALSEAETQHLFEIVRDLKNNRGVGVIFISHRLNELFEICDTLTVLRDGNLVLADQPLTKETTINDIVQYMLGETYDQVLDRSGRTIGEKVLEVEGLTEFTGKCKDCSFYVRSGEIVGIAGLVGAGKTEMLKTLYAALPVSSGVVKVHGKEISPRIPADAVKAGICMIPEERRKEGLELTMSGRDKKYCREIRGLRREHKAYHGEKGQRQYEGHRRRGRHT